MSSCCQRNQTHQSDTVRVAQRVRALFPLRDELVASHKGRVAGLVDGGEDFEEIETTWHVNSQAAVRPPSTLVKLARTDFL